MLIEPSCAPSMREKWTRSPWVSTTAMLSFQRCLVASASAAATSFFAVSRLTGVPYGISNGMPSAVPPADGGAAGGCCAATGKARTRAAVDRKSTRMNSSHQIKSYAVLCLKKKHVQDGQYHLLREKYRY